MQTLSGGLGRRWRQTDATMDVESLGGISVSSSVERQAMREQLDAVRQTLNSLSQPNASGVNTVPAGLDSALAEISSKLTNIEGLYSSLTNKLEKVDLRVEDSERHIKELQHFSASTIHETARLVDYVGGRGTPNARPSSQAGAGPSGVGGVRGRTLAASGVPTTPPQPAVSPQRSNVGVPDYLPTHVTTTIQQHAAQIHKVIAGLDFLEAHIIRQDQLMDNLQKQVLSVARDVVSTSALAENRSSPSELSLRVHDMGELLNKLRAHMYKVEKKTSNNDHALTLLTQRMHAVELSATVGGRQSQREVAESTNGQSSALAAPSVLELVTAQEELRSMVQDLCRDVLELRDQLQAQQAQAPEGSEPVSQAAAGMSAKECVEVRRQLSYLMSQVPDLLAENKELKDFATRASKQIDDLSDELEQQRRRQQEQQQLLEDVTTGGMAANELAAELRSTVTGLRQQLPSLEGLLQNAATRTDVETLSSALQAIENKAASVDAVTGLSSKLTVVEADQVGLREQLAALQDGLDDRAKDITASHLEIEALLAAVQALTKEQSRAEHARTPEDAASKLQRITEGSPEAALLAAQVSASAKADLEEQFGQLRQRVEVATAAADAAEGAARSSAESAAAAVEALAAAGQTEIAATASLQETVLAMVTGLEQEQAALKQQVAQLVAHVSEEQAAISSGLLQVQEQVAAAASAATEAASCAQAVQEQQAASGLQERESAGHLRAMQSELREQVANVMERLKERVEQGMQQMDAQLTAVSDRLSAAVTAQQFEIELEQLRSAVADTSERYELAAVSLEELRAELILLTGQQDVVQSRLQGLESVLGVDALNSRTMTSSTLPSTRAEEGQRQENEEDAGPGPGLDGNLGIGTAEAREAKGGPAARGLLELAAELESRVGGLEGSLEAAATELGQLRALMLSNADRTQDTIQMATSQLMSNLQDLSTAVDQRVAGAAADILAIEATSAALQQKVADQESATSELAVRMEGMQVRLENELIARIQETSATVSSLSARIANDYVSREQLGTIFKARDNMKRAVDELASVFSTGRLMRTASADEDAGDAESSGGAQRSGSGALSPRLVSALEDLAGKQAELEHQVHLALYRTESAVRQEQLASIQQAMLTLEMQFRRLGTSAQQAPPTASAEATIFMPKEMSDLRARVEALEVSLAASTAATAVDPAHQPFAGVTTFTDSPTRRSRSTPGGSLRVTLTPENPADARTPIRLRVMVEEPDAAGSLRLDVGSPDLPEPELDAEEEGGEPSLSSMLHGCARSGLNEESGSVGSSPDALTRTALAAAAREAQSELRDLRRAIQGLSQQNETLRSEVESEVEERHRLAEALAELQERLDMQVNATASTAAMVATMATDQPQERVRLQVRVGATEAEADVATLASTVATLAARVGAAEEALASAFVVRSPRSPARATAAVTAGTASMKEEYGQASTNKLSSAKDAEHETEETRSEEGVRPAFGVMVPVLPHEVEQQLAELQAALSGLVSRVDGLEAADALEEVRAAASEAVLDAIPGMVSQQVAVVREEMSVLVGRHGERLLEMAGQAARDAAEAVLAVREAAAQASAAQAAAEVAAGVRTSTSEMEDLSAGGQADATSIRGVAVAAAREVCMALAREVAQETAHEAVERAVADEVKDVRVAVGSLTDRINDVDALREQGPPGTPTAVAVANIFTPASTALVIPPARTPRGPSPSAGGSRSVQQAATGNQQATFLARLVEMVKRQSSRLHAQYNDAEETGLALGQVDHSLAEAEARLADVRDANSPAFAETLVTVLEQVAALRYIGSQTHPAVQQMVLEHENRLDKIADELKALSGGSPSRADLRAAAEAAPAQAALVDELGLMSRQVARIEAELARLASQEAVLDRAVKDMLIAVGSVRLGSISPSAPGSLATLEDAAAPDSRRVSTHESDVMDEALTAVVRVPAESDGGDLAPEARMDPSQVEDGVASLLEVAGLAAHVRLLEGMLESQLSGLRQELMSEIRARAGSGGGTATVTAATTAAEVSELETTVAKLHSAVTAIRNRLLAMQEYVDSTQSMIKDMHVALGGLVRRVDTMEASSAPGNRSTRVSGCGSVSGGSTDMASIRDLQSELHKFEMRLLALESSTLDTAHALASLKGLAPRVTEVESRLLDTSSKLAVALGGSASSTTPVIPAVAPGTSLPAVAGTVRALERRMAGRVDAACNALDTLASALSAAGRIQAESTANPFKAISAAVNNPVMVAMEKKLESVRAEILAAATSMSEDMRRDQQQHQLESRLASADPSVSGGGVFRV